MYAAFFVGREEHADVRGGGHDPSDSSIGSAADPS